MSTATLHAGRRIGGRSRLGRDGRLVPPGPRGLPVFGSAFAFQADPLGSMLAYHRRYGDVVMCRLARGDMVLLYHPDDIQSVLVGEHQHLVKDDLTHELSRVVGQGLLTSEEPRWRQQRKIAAPSFRPRQIERFAEAMVERTRRYLALLPAASRRDVHPDMMRITLEIVVDTMFGADTVPDVDSVGEIVDAVMNDFSRELLTWRRMIPRRLRPGPEARINDAIRRLDAILYELIRGRREAKGRDAGGRGAALLDRLLEAQDDQGQGMSDEQLRDEVATVFMAGHETTALALSYALHLLAHHPEAAGRLAAEVDEVLQGRPATAADVARLPYADAVIRESMRLYPPAYLVGRGLLREREIANYRLPAGTQVLIPQWVVHRDPRWYDEPERFLPERWLDGLAARLHRFAYFPFGGGPRICVGNHFAMMEGVLVLATLAQALEVAPDPTHALEVSTSVTLRPVNGVRLDVRRR